MSSLNIMSGSLYKKLAGTACMKHKTPLVSTPAGYVVCLTCMDLSQWAVLLPTNYPYPHRNEVLLYVENYKEALAFIQTKEHTEPELKGKLIVCNLSLLESNS